MSEPLTPEQYTQMLLLGGQNENIDTDIRRQEMQAKYLREGNRPQMRNAGNVNVAPHWMELLGGLAREYAGNKQSQSADASSAKRNANSQEQRMLMLQALLRNQQSQPAAGNGLRVGPASQALTPPAQQEQSLYGL